MLIFITRGFATSQLFEIEEYMEKVEMWFRRYEMSHNRTKRQIYLATDEPQVDSTGSILHSLTKYTEILSAGA